MTNNLAKITGKDHEKDHEVLQHLSASIEKLSTEHVFETLAKIIVGHDVLDVQISVSRLKQVLHEAYGLILKTVSQLDDIYSFETPSWPGNLGMGQSSYGHHRRGHRRTFLIFRPRPA